ncbi:MAG: DUF1266 domain-containing protein [Deltaproteobacteria bacterium]|jgi:hypothetical protein|nr:DUF1266 domain-containing protein [Deltaproteobacteria bacterium]
MFGKVIAGLKEFLGLSEKDVFRKNPDAPKIAKEQKGALALCLIDGENIGAYTDSLTTGLPRQVVMRILNQGGCGTNWKDAMEQIEWLLKVGMRVTFDAAVPFMTVRDESERNGRIDKTLNELWKDKKFASETARNKKFLEESERMKMLARNVIQCEAALGDNRFAPFDEKNVKGGILAWDMNWLVLFARLYRDVGFFDENKAWDVIMHAYETAKEKFEDWREVSVSYLIGRGALNGSNPSIKKMYGIAKMAFKDADSPWKNISFK